MSIDIEKINKMIIALLPDAVPGVDFQVVVTADDRAEVTMWNENKLGRFPGLERLREIFLCYARKRKEKMPTFDDSDPLPYLEHKDVKARQMIQLDKLPVVDVTTLGGTTFIRRKQ